MRIKSRVLNSGGSLFENGVRISREFHVQPFLFKFGKFSSIVNRREGFPHENGDKADADNSADDAEDNTNEIGVLRAVPFPVF